MGYLRTQRSPLAWILVLIGAAALVAALANFGDPRMALPAGLFGGVMVILALCFGSLTIADEGESLLVRFGPLPVFRKRVSYRAITDARPGHSSLIDGWGIHYVPWRGWTYNLWGTGCVQLDVDGRTLRIGSDDAENLAGFIRSKLALPEA